MKARPGVLIAVLIVAVVVFAYTRLRSVPVKPTPALVILPGSLGVIFPANSLEKGAWTPKKRDVVDAETGLLSFIKQKAQTNPDADSILKRGLSSYKRQYFGRSDAGGKVLLINLFCDDWGHDWQKEPMFVLDGGSCFFNVQFSMPTKKLSHLHINPRP